MTQSQAPLPEYMAQFERDAIQQARVESRYNKTRAAAQGINFARCATG